MTPSPGELAPLVAPGPPLSAAQVERYSRHVLLPQIGDMGQRRLRNARVCVIGAGGLGAPVLLYLAAAGVGRIGVVDSDDVELSNLHRQVIHRTADLGRAKVSSAAEAIGALDPDIEVVQHRDRLTADNIDLIAEYDLVVDGTDNFPTRYLVNDACVRLGLPEVWGSVFRFDAQVAVFWGRPPAPGPAAVQLRDLFPEPPPPDAVPSCAEAGVLGALCGQVGSLMATEAVKLITGVGDPLLGRVLVLDALAARWTVVPVVGTGRPPADPESTSARHATSGTPTGPVPEVSARELARMLAERGRGGRSFSLVDVREPAEWEIVAIPGSERLPMSHLVAGMRPEVSPGTPLVLYCRSGHRSARAVDMLRAAGYDDVRHLAGGVLAWVDDVDPSLPRY